MEGAGSYPLASPHSPRSFNLGSFIPRRARANTAGSGTGSPLGSPVEERDSGRNSYFPAVSSLRPRNGNYVGLQLTRRNTAQGEVGAGSRSRSTSLSQSQSVAPVQASGQEDMLSSSLPSTSHMQEPTVTPAAKDDGKPTVRVRLVPHLEATSRSLHFDPIVRQMKAGSTLKIGRFNERSISTNAANFETMIIPGGPSDVACMRTTFKSKVVSRAHAEIALDAQSGVFSIRDTSSSSGTFLNHVRLSAPAMESRWHPLRDGDILQLGVDYQGGTEEMYRCVKIKVEIDRKKQKGSQFGTAAFKQLRALHSTNASASGSNANGSTQMASTETTECCICRFCRLISVGICQSLFIAPCSHVYHYKCIRPLLQLHHPGFSCPLCRTFADLDADVDDEQSFMEIEDEAVESENVAKEKDDEELADDTTRPLPAPVASTSNSMSTNNPEMETPARSRQSRSRRSSAASRRSHALAHPDEVPAVPDAGEFQSELRRSSIHVSGPHGNASPIAITGRASASRPGSIRQNITPMASSSRLASSSSSEEDEMPTAVRSHFGPIAVDSQQTGVGQSGNSAETPAAKDASEEMDVERKSAEL